MTVGTVGDRTGKVTGITPGGHISVQAVMETGELSLKCFSLSRCHKDYV